MQSCGNHAAGALPSRGAAGWRGPELTACSVKPSRTCDSSWVPYAAFRFQLLVHLARRRARHDLRRAHRFGHILQGNEAGDQPPLCVPPRSGIDLLLGGSLQSDHAVADPGLGVGAMQYFIISRAGQRPLGLACFLSFCVTDTAIRHSREWNYSIMHRSRPAVHVHDMNISSSERRGHQHVLRTCCRGLRLTILCHVQRWRRCWLSIVSAPGASRTPARDRRLMAAVRECATPSAHLGMPHHAHACHARSSIAAQSCHAHATFVWSLRARRHVDGARPALCSRAALLFQPLQAPHERTIGSIVKELQPVANAVGLCHHGRRIGRCKRTIGPHVNRLVRRRRDADEVLHVVVVIACLLEMAGRYEQVAWLSASQCLYDSPRGRRGDQARALGQR